MLHVNRNMVCNGFRFIGQIVLRTRIVTVGAHIGRVEAIVLTRDTRAT